MLPLAAVRGRSATAAGTVGLRSARAAYTLSVIDSCDQNECRGKIYTTSCDKRDH